MNLGGNTSSTVTSVPNGQFFFAPTAGNLAAPPVNSTEGAKLYATPPIHHSFFATDVAFTIISPRTHLQKEPLRRSRSLSTTPLNLMRLCFPVRRGEMTENGVACPLQWLPVLLTAAPPSLSPPPLPPPSLPPPTSRRRLLKGVFTSKASLKTAVHAYNANPTAVIATYGPIAEWDVSKITDMSYLFHGLTNFNADVSSWNTSSVTDMNHMFRVRSFPAQPPICGRALSCTLRAPRSSTACCPPSRTPRPAPHALLSTLGRARRHSTSR